MKKINVMIMVVVLFLITNVFAQEQQVGKHEFYKIKLDSLAIAYSKTTNIVFPNSILSVDRGSSDVLVQKAKGVDNILQIKAAQQDFTETNLTVVTADGQLHSFVVNYDEKKPLLNLVVGQKNSISDHLGSTEIENEAELKSYAELAFYEKKKVYNVKDYKYDMKLQLNGLFIHEGVMYFRINLENNSNVSYDISQFRFFIRDQKKTKRTASQEIEIHPLYIYNSTEIVVGKSEVCLVFALPKFTIPDKKYLAIQLMEDQGGRHLELQVKNKKLMQLTVLPTL
ncbi:conjugative transposon protein TraN [Flavobacterium seoulense]|uniref:Conjugative transposon protein TraN n=1 Tax=Flavobacterium seoulense TaxID=1492738 RepID=A0A066WVG9_9FLAO|nr:conjugative transposon protein TraN [Flavobacterium seoulense]KDN54665.1 conjugative transposon protein TraN [Flavobacterium seoulense]